VFFDLKDSTAIAEKLGHIIYSKLLQQCCLGFNPLHALEIVMKAQSAKKEALMLKRHSTAMVI
jgi:hypothetical protein